MLKILCMSWNSQFCMSQLTMMYLRNFLVFAQLIILFGIGLSAAEPAEARQRHIVNILCDFCGKSFPNSWAYERHRTCTKLKGNLRTGCYSQATHKVELFATRRGTMATAMLSRSLSQGHRGSYVLISEISTWPAYFHEISTWVPNYASF